MRLHPLRSIAATLTVLMFAACSTPAPKASTVAPVTEGLPSALQAVIDDALAESHVPGAAVIVDAGAEPWVSLTGFSNVAESTRLASSDRFSYRSITKSFIVTVILKLAADGAVGLDDPVSRWIPDVPAGAEITLRQLAGMRSGLPSYTRTDEFRKVFAENPTATFTDLNLVGFAFREESHFEPGERYEYSNTNTVLLGLVIEAVTGEDWASAVGRIITGPLHLASVSYPGPMRIPAPAATGYRVVDGEVVEAPTPVATAYSAAGGLSGEIADLDRWGRALGSGELLSPEFQGVRLEDASPVSDDPDSPDYDSYGLGIGEIDGWWGHTGYGLGFSALVMHDPVGQRTITILLNGSPRDHDLPAAMFRDFLAILDDAAA
ncbi:MAG: class beta-lactamase-related serine hydrolase [Cryobacterium sp.]|jgi:D-alanyl-D-alanine carboxypeptidase|nr:class beta-lactamase-related serine hydrolase [Cryobacterium sp.]